MFRKELGMYLQQIRCQDLMKKKKIILLIVVVIFVGFLILLNYLNDLNNYKEKIASTRISPLDFREIPDGVYVGDYDVDFIYAKVEVTVKNGQVTDIKLLEHKNGRGQKAEKIVEDIKAAQSLEVDTVSGATNSTVVIKKAIENALINAVH